MRVHSSWLTPVLLWLLAAQVSDPPSAAFTLPKTVTVRVGTQEAKTIPWTTTLTIHDVIYQFGITYEGPNLRRFRLVRDGERTVWDLRKMQRGEIPPPKVQPEDIIELPWSG